MTRTNNRTLAQIGIEIKRFEKNSISNVIKIGELLHEASEKPGYMDWLRAEFAWSYRTAKRYRDVYALAVAGGLSRQIADSNISISVVYLLAEYGPASPFTKAIIKAAAKNRVSYAQARVIIEQIEKDTEPASVEDSDGDDDPPPTRKSKKKKKASPPDKPLTRQDEDDDELVTLLRRLLVVLCDPVTDIKAAIIELGTDQAREIVGRLKHALDIHSLKTSIQQMADAAEARSKVTSISEDSPVTKRSACSGAAAPCRGGSLMKRTESLTE